MKNKKQLSTLLTILVIVGAFFVLRSAIRGTTSSNIKDSDFQEDSLTAQAGCTAPSLANIAVGNVTATSVVIGWTTNQQSTSQIKLGTSNNSMQWKTTMNTPASTSGVINHSYPVSGLQSNKTYYYRVRSSNGSCQKTSSTYSFMTLGQQSSPDVTAPSTPSGLSATNITNTSFTLGWNASTDPAVAGAVTSGVKGYEVYGPVGACAVSGIAGYCGAVIHTGTTTTYSLPITGLTANTTYSGSTGATAGFTVLAFDNANNYSQASARKSVTTTTGGTITCNDPTATNYGGPGPCVYQSIDLCPNIQGNQTTIPTGMVININGDCVAGADTTPPNITALSSINITATSVTITWTTNEPATSVVNYGTSMAYGTVVSNPTLVTNHSVTISGLTPNTSYMYEIRTADASGNTTTTGENAFTTLPGGDTTPPVISSITTSAITQTGATISWTTNESATSVVEYGTSTSYGQTVSSAILSTGHSATLTGLSSNTTYHYRVKSADSASNLSTSTDRVMTTLGTTASCPNAAPFKDQRQMWVWKESIAMLSPGSIQTNLFNYVDAKKVTMVYMSMHASEITSNASAIKTFLDTAWNSHCLQVQFLDGDASWVTPNFSAAVAWATAAKNLDLSIASGHAHPYGLNIDVENYSSLSSTEGKTNYINMLGAIKNAVAGTSLKVVAVIPRWYDNSYGISFMQSVINASDEIGIMNYVVTASSFYTDASNELAYAQSVGKKVVLGAETIDLTPWGGDNTPTSFYGKSCAALNGMFDGSYTSIMAIAPNAFGGFAVHDFYQTAPYLGGWKPLCP